MYSRDYNNNNYYRDRDRDRDRCRDRDREENENNNGHVHEFLGSTMLAAEPDNNRNQLHNHRFAGVSGPARPFRGSHVHVIRTRTDFFDDHFHEIDVISGIAIPVFNENHREIGHVHGFSGTTTVEERHTHDFKGATLIEDPISREN
jgi:hypothetical protein